jgi:hypothetical protein
MEENKEQQSDQSELGQKIQTLRTYSSDMADAVRENEISVIKVALAEKAKREKEEDFRIKSEGTGLQKFLLITGSIIFIALGLIGSYFLFEKSQQQVASQPAAPLQIQTLISYDTSAFIDATTAGSVFDLASLVKAPLTVAGSPQSIHALFFTKKIGTTTTELSLPDFLTALNLSAPGALTRSLSAYMVGTYDSVDTTQKPHLFLMFQTQDYNQAYASMLQWEPTMLGDVAPLFGIDISGDNNSLLRKPFKDILINNNDARVLYDANGNALLYYIFIDKNDFIITDSQEAIREVTIRLQTKNTRSL